MKPARDSRHVYQITTVVRMPEEIISRLSCNLLILNRLHSVAQTGEEGGGGASRCSFRCVSHRAIFTPQGEVAAPLTAQSVTSHEFIRFQVHA